MNSPFDNVLQTALRKKAEGRGMKNSEIGAIARSRIPNRPVANNYRPLGAIVNQIPDRIHSLGDPNGSNAAPFVFDNELHFNNGSIQIDIDANGIAFTDLSDGTSFTIASDGTVTWTDGGDNTITIGAGDIVISGASGSLDISFGDITHDMSIKTISVCDSGVTKSMDLIASDPY